MRTLLLSLIVLGAACCTQREATKPVEPAITAKPGAPTQLESKVSPGSVNLALKFDGEGTNVRAGVTGIEGVTVQAVELLTAATVKAGEVRNFEVAYSGTKGHVVISVSGVFGGAERTRVHSVEIGSNAVDGTVQTTSDGDTVKVMP